MLRKYYPNIDVLILSAKYGLIRPEQVIYKYDLSIERADAAQLCDKVERSLEQMKLLNYPTIYVEMGKKYYDVLESAVLKYQWYRGLPNKWSLRVRTFAYEGSGVGMRDQAFSRWCKKYRDDHPGRPDWVKLVQQ